MKSSSKKEPEVNLPQSKTGFVWGEQPLECEEIQEVLLAYMSRELGEAQSILVREHIRKCDTCRAESAEIEETLEMLNRSKDEEAILQLSDERRKRILLAVFHPVINWIDIHHKLVSIVLALIVLATTIFALRNFAIFRSEPLEEGIPIWKYFKSGELPELIEQRLKEEGDRSQKLEVRSQKSGTTKRGQESGVRSQSTEIRAQESGGIEVPEGIHE